METETTSARRSPTLAAALAAAGGAAAAVGSVLTWATVTGRRETVDVNGSELFGVVTVACGVAAVAAGLLLLSARSTRARALLAALVLAAGLAAGGVGAYVATSDDPVGEALSERGGRAQRIGRGRRGPEINPAIGLYLVVAGGGVAAAGGVAGLISARERRSTEVAAARVLDASAGGRENTPTSREEDGT